MPELKLRVGQGVTGWVPARQARPVGDVRRTRATSCCARCPLRTGRAAGSHGRSARRAQRGFRRTDAFSQSDQELLEELAVQAAKVIHNTWLYEQSRLKARLLETLVSVSRSINSALNVDEALQVITREACTLMEARMCSLSNAG
jgi:hypothetical protein